MRHLWWTFFGRTGRLLLDPMLEGHESELTPILKEFIEVVAAEPPLTLERLLHTWLERDQCRTRLLMQMRQFPVLLCPVRSPWRNAGTWMAKGSGIWMPCAIPSGSILREIPQRWYLRAGRRWARRTGCKTSE